MSKRTQLRSNRFLPEYVTRFRDRHGKDRLRFRHREHLRPYYSETGRPRSTSILPTVGFAGRAQWRGTGSLDLLQKIGTVVRVTGLSEMVSR